MELNDRQLAIRWWYKKTDLEKLELSKRAKFPRENFKSLTGSEIEWIWKNQPYNDLYRIKRKNRLVFVKKIRVKFLDKSKCSSKFLSHKFPEDKIVNIKCNADGTFDFRGKKQEYRIIVEDEK